MKNIRILRLMSNLIVTSIFLGYGSLSVFADDQLTSPRLECYNFASLIKDNSLRNSELKCNLKDNFIQPSFNAGPLSLQPDEKVFFIAKDKVSGKELSKQVIYYRNRKVPSTPFETPYYCDEIYFDVYKQKDTEPDFTVKQENFLGSYRTNATNNLVYRRGNEIALGTVRDKYGNRIEGFFFSQITPNYYSIRIPDLYFEESVGIVVLPQSQANLMKEEQRYFPADYYALGKTPGSAVWPNAVTREDSYFNFYVPEGVTEFKFVVYYDDVVVDDASKIAFQYNIKLNK